ncbi:MAG: hypothetical protein LC749_12600 [Actinobacteria bacterium]|nr:hypothetical protein [Actinomycetota bacterium]
MGDRANIYVEMPARQGVSGVYLYTHWSGYRWPEALREALAFGQSRWHDDQYLARIVTSRVFHDLVDSETGGGLSLTMGDNEYQITVLDLVNQEVSFADEGEEMDPTKRHHHMPFAQYIAQESADYPPRNNRAQSAAC